MYICDDILITNLKKYIKDHNYFKITTKMNYFTRLIREINLKYEGDNTPFLTMEEIDNIRLMFQRLICIIHDCHFRENINTIYYINKIMDYLEICLVLA